MCTVVSREHPLLNQGLATEGSSPASSECSSHVYFAFHVCSLKKHWQVCLCVLGNMFLKIRVCFQKKKMSLKEKQRCRNHLPGECGSPAAR